MSNEHEQRALTRVFEAAGCRTQTELADFFGIRQSSIADAKKRGSIPAEWLVTLLKKRGINPEWIMTGQGPRLLEPAGTGTEAALPAPQSPPVATQAEGKQTVEDCTMDELVAEILRRARKALR